VPLVQLLHHGLHGLQKARPRQIREGPRGSSQVVGQEAEAALPAARGGGGGKWHNGGTQTQLRASQFGCRLLPCYLAQPVGSSLRHRWP
jgi:hypothetical protein